MCRLLRPNCDLFGRTKLTKYLKEHADGIRTQLLKDLPPNRKVSLALDCWTSMNHHGFMSITAYFVTDTWEFREALLAFHVLTGKHSGKSLAHITASVLRRYGIQRQLLAITADNARNNGTLRRELEKELEREEISWDSENGSIPCLSHVIQLAVQAFLKTLRCRARNEDVGRKVSDRRLGSLRSQKDLTTIRTIFQKVGFQNRTSVFVQIRELTFNTECRFAYLQFVSIRLHSKSGCLNLNRTPMTANFLMGASLLLLTERR